LEGIGRIQEFQADALLSSRFLCAEASAGQPGTLLSTDGNTIRPDRLASSLSGFCAEGEFPTDNFRKRMPAEVGNSPDFIGFPAFRLLLKSSSLHGD
jgi:hypothetical protein